MIEKYVFSLMDVFYNSYINRLNELILIPKTNLYFSLNGVKSELDLKCKVIEWCSRDAYKSMPYRSERHNIAYRNDVRNKINKYLGTNFSFNDMDLIYTKLGNSIHHDLTIKFVESGYDINLLI